MSHFVFYRLLTVPLMRTDTQVSLSSLSPIWWLSPVSLCPVFRGGGFSVRLGRALGFTRMCSVLLVSKCSSDGRGAVRNSPRVFSNHLRYSWMYGLASHDSHSGHLLIRRPCPPRFRHRCLPTFCASVGASGLRGPEYHMHPGPQRRSLSPLPDFPALSQ